MLHCVFGGRVPDIWKDRTVFIFRVKHSSKSLISRHSALRRAGKYNLSGKGKLRYLALHVVSGCTQQSAFVISALDGG
jgi:hypothetical protein